LTRREKACFARGIEPAFLWPFGGKVGSAAGEHAWHRMQCDGGACIEVAGFNEAVIMRSSANPDATLTMSRIEWREFLTGAKAGLFDEL
jgi:Domain of unknown function (DUF397)